MSNLSGLMEKRDVKREHKTVWIEGLPGSSGKKKSKAVREYEQTRQSRQDNDDLRELPTLITDKPLSALRKKSLQPLLAKIDMRYDTIDALATSKKVPKETNEFFTTFRERIEPMIERARELASRDLSDNQASTDANLQIDLINRQIDEAMDHVTPGFAEFHKEMETFSLSDLATEAQQAGLSRTPPIDLQDRFDVIFMEAIRTGSVREGRSRMEELKKRCEEIRSNADVENKAYAEQVNRLKDFKKTTSEYSLAIKDKAVSKELKTLLEGQLNDAEGWLMDGAAETDSVAKAKKALDELGALLSDLNTDAQACNDKARFIKPLDFIIAYGPKAQSFDAAHQGNSQAKLKLADTWPTTLKANLPGTENDFKKITEAQEAIQKILKAASAKWKVEQKNAGVLIKLAQRAAAATTQNEDTDPNDTVRSNEAKAIYLRATQITKLYSEALDFAKDTDYVQALQKLSQAIPLAESLRDDASAAVEEGMRDTAKVEEEEKAALSLFKKSYDTNTDAWLYLSGESRDQDGNLIPSEHLTNLMRVMENALKRWRKMVQAGNDPVSAGERAFLNIPKNFWPPEAVRAVAMFRRAEAAFEEEERAKQVEEQLTGAKVMGETVDIMESKLKIEMIAEVPEQVGNTLKKAMEFKYAEGIKDHLKELHSDWSKEEIEKATKEQIDHMPASEAAVGLMAFAGGMKTAFSAFKVATDVADLVEKQKAMSEEELSPVACKMREFQRNRAIAHLALDAIDTILNCAGIFNEIVPGLGIGADAKTVALSIMEAGRYFMMLHEVVTIRSKAKKDPETMMHLALAKEAKETLLKGGKRVFEAGVALLKVAGGAAEVAGPASPAGFAVKKGALVLEYCGKLCFFIGKKISIANAKKILARARRQPIDYEAVEEVFSHSQDFARYALAYGCTDGDDPWARQLVLSRGLTDSDLNNPETSASIVREYLNVTFEGLSGESQEDEEWRKPKKKKTGPEDRAPYIGTWETSDLSLSAWDTNLSEALGDELYNDKSTLKAIGKAMSAAASAVTEYEEALSEYGTDREAAETAEIDGDTELDKLKEQLLKSAEAFKLKIETVVPALDLVHTELGNYLPLRKSTSKLKKPSQVHKGMQDYCKLVSNRAASVAQEAQNLRYTVERDLKILKAGSEEEARRQDEEEMNKAVETNQEDQKKRRAKIRDQFQKMWNEAQIDTPWKAKATLAEAGTKAEAGIGLSSAMAAKLQRHLNRHGKRVFESYLDRFYGTGKNLPPNAPEKAKKKQEELLESFMKQKLVQASGEMEAYLIDEASKLWMQDKSDTTGAEFKFTLVNPDRLSAQDWEKNKEKADDHHWVRKKTNIGEALEKFEEADRQWQLVKTDLLLIANWRTRLAALRKVVNAWQPLATNGLLHPTMNEYKAKLKKAITEADINFRKLTANQSKSGGSAGTWTPAPTELDNWPINLQGWKDMQSIAEANRWKKKSPNGTTKAFIKVDDAEETYQQELQQNAVTNKTKTALKEALMALHKKLDQFDDKHFQFQKGDERFVGMENFVKKLKARVYARLNGPEFA